MIKGKHLGHVVAHRWRSKGACKEYVGHIGHIGHM